MGEHEWLTSEDPAAMLRYLKEEFVGYPFIPYPEKGEQRWVPRQQPLISDRQKRMWVFAMRSEESLARQKEGRLPVRWFDTELTDLAELDGCAMNWASGTDSRIWVPMAYRAHLLREIVGNPFRPVRLGFQCERCCGTGIQAAGLWNCATGKRDSEPGVCTSCSGLGQLCSWLTPTVKQLAQAIYDGKKCDSCECERGWIEDTGGVTPWGEPIEEWFPCPACNGTGRLDCWDDMPILADALEESGCTDEEILHHCRGEERCPADCQKTSPSGKYCHYEDAGPYESKWHKCQTCKATGWIPLRGPHVRGCWVVDLILGHE